VSMVRVKAESASAYLNDTNVMAVSAVTVLPILGHTPGRLRVEGCDESLPVHDAITELELSVRLMGGVKYSQMAG